MTTCEAPASKRTHDALRIILPLPAIDVLHDFAEREGITIHEAAATAVLAGLLGKR